MICSTFARGANTAEPWREVSLPGTAARVMPARLARKAIVRQAAPNTPCARAARAARVDGDYGEDHRYLPQDAQAS